MTANLTNTEQTFVTPDKYLAVTPAQDGRYCVQFVKHGFPPRTSYASSAGEVIQQAQRAGRLPVHTSDEALQQACRDQNIQLI